MALVSSMAMDRISDALFRVARWRRQVRLIAGDPLALEPRVDPHAVQLGFVHVYVAREIGETARWLRSTVYAGEAAKRDPIDTCHLAIDQFHTFLETGDPAAREDFVVIARELLATGHTTELGGRTCFVVPHFDQVEDYARHATPWINAMVQGWVGAVLARAYQVTGEDGFAEAARRAVGPCFVPLALGGVRDLERNQRVFYEKYALPGQTRHVLNGFMASLLGIWDVARATGDRDARHAFEEGVASLDDTVLGTYDNGHTSLYDQRDDQRATPSCVFYTWVHARQLASLARITRQERLRWWAARWRGYTHGTEHRARTALECLGYRARSLPRYLGLDRAPEAPDVS
jgi:D-glucuronyl C5-epimerase-like protein